MKKNMYHYKGQLKEKKNILKAETAKLDTEQKLFHDYLSEKNNWEQKKKAKITGASDQPDTLEFFKTEAEYLDNKLGGDLETKS